MSRLGYKRKSPRVERIVMTGMLQRHDSGELAENTIGRTLNISEGGILLETVHPAPFLSKVSLSIALHEYILDVRGEVVHLKRATNGHIEMGVKFIEISTEGKEMLKMFIS